jgi:Cu+-exporting ATPase
MTAAMPSSQAPEHQARHARHLRNSWVGATLAALATALLYLMARPPLLTVANSRPIPLIPALIAPDGAPQAHASLQLAIGLAALVIGHSPMIGGIKDALRREPSLDSLVASGAAAAFAVSVVKVALVMSGQHSMVHGLCFDAAATVITLAMLGRAVDASYGGHGGVGEDAPMSRLAAKLSRAFVPTTYAIALLAAFAWYLASRLGAAEPPPNLGSLTLAIDVMVSVLVVACPCMLGAATTTTAKSGMAKGINEGIRFRDGAAMEQAGTVGTVLLGLSGTLTEGRPVVTDVIPAAGFSRWSKVLVEIGIDPALPAVEPSSQLARQAGTLPCFDRALFDLVGDDDAMRGLVRDDVEMMLVIAAAAEGEIGHPLARAVARAAAERGLEPPPVEGRVMEPGLGVSAYLASDMSQVAVGNDMLMMRLGVDVSGFASLADGFAADGKAVVYVAAGGELSGLIAFTDAVKQDAQAAVQAMMDSGLEVMLMTSGDHRRADAVAHRLGIRQVLSELSLDGKATELARLQESGRRLAYAHGGDDGAVMMTMSGLAPFIDDAGSMASRPSDITLAQGDPLDVARALLLSRQTLGAIRQNLVLAMAFYVIALPSVAGLLYAFGGPPPSPAASALAVGLGSIAMMAKVMRLGARKL